MKVLIISVGVQNYILDTDPILRITRPGEILTLKGSPKFIRGITKFRNEVVPIIDLPERFGIRNPEKHSIYSCFVILQGPRGLIALYADSAEDIMEINIPANHSTTEKKIRRKALKEITLDGCHFFSFQPKNLLSEKEWKQLDDFICNFKNSK